MAIGFALMVLSPFISHPRSVQRPGEAKSEESQGRVPAKERRTAAEQRAEARAEADLRAQIRMADEAVAQTYIGVAGLVGLIATVAFAMLAWIEGRRTAKIAYRDLIERDRPQFNIRIREHNLFEALDSPTDVKYPATVDFRPVNIGKRAAIVTGSGAEVVIGNALPTPEPLSFGQHIVIEERQDFPIVGYRVLEGTEKRT